MPSTRELLIAVQVAPKAAPLLRAALGRRWRSTLKRALQSAVTALCRAEARSLAGELCFYFTTDLEMRALNGVYRGIECTTDVLSFAYEATMSTEEAPIGDVVISVETAQRQAGLNQHDLLTELLMLALHGTLHLMGYDDSSEVERAQMNARAASTLRELGYAAREEWCSQYENA
ncbi:MAG: rRNA maturation RNase YbeY [Armatimonadota bacterium]|nr:rRNA maturation RNase YbeY [Armatimonadota bacterium]